MIRSVACSFLLCFTFASQSACRAGIEVHDAAETAAARQTLLGRWYGEKILEEGSHQRWLMERFTDGTYRIDFELTSPNNSIESWSETGIWGVRLPIYFTVTQTMGQNDLLKLTNASDPSFYDAYHVQTLAKDSFVYESYTSGNVFQTSKVDSNFRLDIRTTALTLPMTPGRSAP